MITLSTGRVLLVFLGAITLYGCEGLLVTDTQSLLAPTFTRSRSSAWSRGSERPLPPCRT